MSLITSQNAREMSAKSHAACQRNKAEREAMRSLGEQAPQHFPQTTTQNLTSDGFVRVHLEWVREQLKRVYGWMKETTDPAQYDKLCSASSKLEEQERRLSDRSLPPVRRAQEQAKPQLGHGSSLFLAGMDEV